MKAPSWKATIHATLALLLTLVAPGIVAGQVLASAQPQATHSSFSANTPAPQQRNPRYQLRRGDVFDIEFTFSPEMNQTVTVQPDGYVTAKVIGGGGRKA